MPVGRWENIRVDFNSNLVRLKVDLSCFRFVAGLHFNSNLVRLKVGQVT